jgi:hypothetical protein
MKPLPDLELDEVTISSGELYGSVYLDQAFLAYVKNKVGRLSSSETRKDVGNLFSIQLNSF